MTRKNPFLLFLSACIPGCGQMYQGYMKRGVSLMSAFALITGVAAWLYFGQLALALPVLWLYAFFDTYSLRRALENGTEEPDAYLFGLSGVDKEQLCRLLDKRHSLIGWALVLLGLYGLWQAAAHYFSDFLSNIFGYDFYWLASYQLPRLVIFLLVIALGVWFIRGPKQQREDDFNGFTPPSSGSASTGAAPDGAPEFRKVVDSVLGGADTSSANSAASEKEGSDHDGQ